MKTRNGFVSNSSSSSFVLFLDKNPKDECELEEMLFGKYIKENIKHEYNEYEVSTYDIALAIYEQIRKNGVITRDGFIDEVENNMHVEAMYSKNDYATVRAEIVERAEREVEELYRIHEGKYITWAQFGNEMENYDYQLETLIEQTNEVFQNIDHIKASHH